MAGKKRLTKEAVVKAIEKSHGINTDACKILNVSRTTFYKFLDDNPDLQDEIKTAKLALLDEAEGHLAKAVRKGTPWAVRFVLSTIGKNDWAKYQKPWDGMFHHW